MLLAFDYVWYMLYADFTTVYYQEGLTPGTNDDTAGWHRCSEREGVPGYDFTKHSSLTIIVSTQRCWRKSNLTLKNFYNPMASSRSCSLPRTCEIQDTVCTMCVWPSRISMPMLTRENCTIVKVSFLSIYRTVATWYQTKTRKTTKVTSLLTFPRKITK